MTRVGLVVGLALVLGGCDSGYDVIGDDDEVGSASNGATGDGEDDGDDGGSDDDATAGSGDSTGGGSTGDVSTGGGSNDDDSTTGEDPAGSTDGGDAGVFEQDIVPILQARCGCHTDGSPAAGLDLSPAAAYDALVGVASSTALPYVSAGPAADSYLVHKMQGTQLEVVGGSGSRMPPGEGVIPSGEIDAVIAWIDSGAQ